VEAEIAARFAEQVRASRQADGKTLSPEEQAQLDNVLKDLFRQPPGASHDDTHT
jgi:hypothetical protein